MRFSGIVVTLNDEERLRSCLDSLSFCDQLVVVDLGSTDLSVEIAKECRAEVHQYAREPIVEKIWPQVASLLNNDWVIRLDPDEIFPPIVVPRIERLIEERADIAIISLPHQFYFLGKPLRGTIWGGVRTIGKVVSKSRIEFVPYVHSGMRILPGHQVAELSAHENGVIQHFWADSYKQLIEKHRRYIREEGTSRYQAGEEFSWPRFIRAVLSSLRQNLITRYAWRDGWRGIFLTAFHAWYTAESLLALKKHENRLRKAATG